MTTQIQPLNNQNPDTHSVSFADIINIQQALVDLLTEETEHMHAMRLEKVQELQDRKLKLTALLERNTLLLKRDPELKGQITGAEKDALKAVAERLEVAMRKNYDTLLVARAVNDVVVKTVTKVAIEERHNPIYNAQGVNGKHDHTLVSFSLNHTI